MTADGTIAMLTPGNRQDELAAFVALLRAGARPAHRLATIAEEIGSAARLLQIRPEDSFRSIPDATHAFAGLVTDNEIATASQDVEAWLAAGIDVRSVLDASYPANLRGIFDRPPLLFFRGSWREETDSRAIAVVGTRKASPDGIKRTRRLCKELVAANVAIFSGLAAGIDTSAHEATLDANGRTIAVMGTGLHRIYPKENAELAARIVESGGALLSPFFPEQPPTKWTFPVRNTVMSGLTLATVVIEASVTSGAKMQARFALQHGRAVFLPASLVAAHTWASEYVSEGRYGTRAIEFSSTREIIDRIDSETLMPDALAV